MSTTESVTDIFNSNHDGTFNACVGRNGLHNFRTYAEGYIDASIFLLQAIFNKRLLNSRDTLVYPILYSVRHSIELSIKYVLTALNKCDLKTDKKKITGHSLGTLWSLYKIVAKYDSRLNTLFQSMNTIVTYLDEVDKNAQDFRYPEGNAQQGNKPKQTLEGKGIIDLTTTYREVKKLKELLISLFDNVEIVIEQRSMDSFTPELNRDELKMLSEDCRDDSSKHFSETKKKWKKVYNLSGKGFDRAICFIRKHREFAGNIGKEHKLIALSSELLKQIVELKKKSIQRKTEYSDSSIFCRTPKLYAELNADCDKFKSDLTPEVIADLEALYYLSSVNYYSEEYQDLYERLLRKFPDKTVQQKECRESFIRLLEKVPFLKYLISSLRLVGQVKLSEQLKADYKIYIEG